MPTDGWTTAPTVDIKVSVINEINPDVIRKAKEVALKWVDLTVIKALRDSTDIVNLHLDRLGRIECTIELMYRRIDVPYPQWQKEL